MYGIVAVNRGMWACESWCKDESGEILSFETEAEAQKVADKYNSRSHVNNFTQYFVEKF